MIPKLILAAVIVAIVWFVIWMAEASTVYTNECKAKGGELMRLYPDSSACVDLKSIVVK